MDERGELEARLARLEGRQRRGRAALLAGLALVGATAFAGQDAAPREETAEVLRAERVELVDAGGRVRAELAIDAEGSAGLFLRDAEGRKRATLTHDEGGTALYLYDEEETVRVGTAQFAHGGGGYALHGPEGRGAAVLYLKGEGSLTFYDVEGAVLGRVPEGR